MSMRAASGASSRIARSCFPSRRRLPSPCNRAASEDPRYARRASELSSTMTHPCARALRMRADVLQGAAKFFDLLVRLFSSDTITFLDLAGEVFAIALGNREIVISELAPLRLELAGELFPLPLVLVFFHENPRAPVTRRAVVNGKVVQSGLSAPSDAVNNGLDATFMCPAQVRMAQQNLA